MPKILISNNSSSKQIEHLGSIIPNQTIVLYTPKLNLNIVVSKEGHVSPIIYKRV